MEDQGKRKFLRRITLASVIGGLAAGLGGRA